MSTGQVFLSLGALILLAIVSIGIQQLFVQSVQETVGSQKTADAVNYGRDLSEEVYSFAFNHKDISGSGGTVGLEPALRNEYDGYQTPETGKKFRSQIGKLYSATFDIETKTNVAHQQDGVEVRIRIYEQLNDDNYGFQAEYIALVTPISN